MATRRLFDGAQAELGILPIVGAAGSIAGDLAAVESGADTFDATGSAGSGAITGNLAATESGADTLSAEGVVKVAGSLAATETDSDTFAATGSAASGTVTGNLIATLGAATLFSEGVLPGAAVADDWINPRRRRRFR